MSLCPICNGNPLYSVLINLHTGKVEHYSYACLCGKCRAFSVDSGTLSEAWEECVGDLNFLIAHSYF